MWNSLWLWCFYPSQKGLQALRWTSRCSSRCPSRCAIHYGYRAWTFPYLKTRQQSGTGSKPRAGQEPPLDAHHPCMPGNPWVPWPEEFLSRWIPDPRDGQSQRLRISWLRDSSAQEVSDWGVFFGVLGIQGWWASKGGSWPAQRTLRP